LNPLFSRKSRIIVFEGVELNIEDDLSFPASVRPEELEVMKGNGFDVSAGRMAIRVKFLSQGNRFQHVLAIFFLNLDLMSPQH
jgi:hypothetical protein